MKSISEVKKPTRLWDTRGGAAFGRIFSVLSLAGIAAFSAAKKSANFEVTMGGLLFLAAMLAILALSGGIVIMPKGATYLTDGKRFIGDDLSQSKRLVRRIDFSFGNKRYVRIPNPSEVEMVIPSGLGNTRIVVDCSDAKILPNKIEYLEAIHDCGNKENPDEGAAEALAMFLNELHIKLKAYSFLLDSNYDESEFYFRKNFELEWGLHDVDWEHIVPFSLECKPLPPHYCRLTETENEEEKEREELLMVTG